MEMQWKSSSAAVLAMFIVGVCPQFSAKNGGLAEGENYPDGDAAAGFEQAGVADSVNSLSETIPGEPSSDYPTYTSIPRTAFSCLGRANWGYYADVETGCQVFHVCDNGSKTSFLCPVGSIFNQRHLTCQWWYTAACEEILAPVDEFGNQLDPADELASNIHK